jgi:hypothetical protein
MRTPTFGTFRAIFSPFKPKSSENARSIFNFDNFSEFKFENGFGCHIGRRASMPTFVTFRAIFSPFKPKSSENARSIFNFDQLLRIEI